MTIVHIHRLPAAFRVDRDERDLPTGWLALPNITDIDLEDALEYLSDAEYYASRCGPDVGIGLKSSARASVKALRAALAACHTDLEAEQALILAALGAAEAADATYEGAVVRWHRE
jgi:hypothetical protein